MVNVLEFLSLRIGYAKAVLVGVPGYGAPIIPGSVGGVTAGCVAAALACGCVYACAVTDGEYGAGWKALLQTVGQVWALRNS